MIEIIPSLYIYNGKCIKPNFEKQIFNDAITISLSYTGKILKVKPFLFSTKGKITEQSSREKFLFKTSELLN